MLPELRSRQPTLSSAYGRIAAFVLERPEEALRLSISTLAGRAGVSEAPGVRVSPDWHRRGWGAPPRGRDGVVIPISNGGRARGLRGPASPAAGGGPTTTATPRPPPPFAALASTLRRGGVEEVIEIHTP